MSTPKTFTCSGSLRGPFENTAARMIVDITAGAAKCTTADARAAYIGAMLDEVRDAYSDVPQLVTLVCRGLCEHASRRGLLGA